LKYFHSLTFKLIAIGVLLVTVGSAVRYLMLEKTLKLGIEEVVNAQQFSLATYVAQDIDHKVVARRQALTDVAATMPLPLLRLPLTLEAWLGTQTRALGLFPAGLVVVEAQGRGALADFPFVAGRRQLDFNDRDWFIAVRDGADFAIGKPSIGRAVKVAVVNMAVPVRNAQQQLVAVLMGVTPLADPGFLDLVESGNVGKTGGLLLVSPRDKLFVTASEADMRLRPLPAPGINPLHDRAMGGWRGTGLTHNARGEEELSAVVSIPSANWFLVARTPSAEAFSVVDALLNSVIQNSIKAAALLLVLLVALTAYLFRPLNQAARQMRAMAHGQIPLAPLPVVRHDEVGAMVSSFNELVDKLLQSESRMRYLAHHDALTSLENRTAFQQNLLQGVALADRQQSSLALLFIDLDGFKAVNDTFGHDVGDQLLVQVAQRLRACVRASDMVGRLGGDEFVLLLTDNPTAEQARQIADKVIDAICKPYQIADAQPALGASIGIAMYPDQAKTADQLLIVADTAMYQAKRDGGRRHHLAA
jgi:diguanylate cyclase (GGDEF)-like protein